MHLASEIHCIGATGGDNHPLWIHNRQQTRWYICRNSCWKDMSYGLNKQCCDDEILTVKICGDVYWKTEYVHFWCFQNLIMWEKLNHILLEVITETVMCCGNCWKFRKCIAWVLVNWLHAWFSSRLLEILVEILVECAIPFPSTICHK